MDWTHVAAIVAMAGSAAYAVGDVLMLAPRIGTRLERRRRFDFGAVPGLARRVELFDALGGNQPSRLVTGALLGVFATPLVLAGFWVVYRALEPAGPGYAMPTVLLLTVATVLGCFVHGSFLPLAEYIGLLDEASDLDRPVVLARFMRHLGVIKLSYGIVFLAAIAGAIWYSVAVATGTTSLPRWMAAINPVTLTAAWLGPKRFLPDVVVRYTEGAGFNIAYLIWFAAIAAQVW